MCCFLVIFLLQLSFKKHICVPFIIGLANFVKPQAATKCDLRKKSPNCCSPHLSSPYSSHIFLKQIFYPGAHITSKMYIICFFN